ncbi:type II secretion system protein GspL [Paucibacter sp. APW11]|uniref:Type II secretion system protein GspL n=1 Tax=Roseateles aquae TaxID=3077235 RepID=A0ABU3PJ61_9BURK|nr:type II secretion system protein GspL [Paucibacter sp. APW11]MDT9002173.1 type II secretion system protein GspL [Paucibacter sp. APW11]
MSTTLLLLLPARPRLRSHGRGAEAPARSEAPEYDYIVSTDGEHISAQGRATASELPSADQIIAVPAESDLSWHRVTLPRAGRQRLRAALAGMLEETLLDDPESLHFAVEPEASGGDEAWVCAVHKAWVLDQLSQLDQAQVFVDRLSPAAWPEQPPCGHFYADGVGDGDEPAGIGLRWSHPEGAASLCIDGGLTRKLFPPTLVQASRWTATPAAAAAAERWLGTAVQVQSPEQRALRAARSPWNLRQFELAPRTRGIRALRLFWRGLMAKPWRPVRWGVGALIVLQLLALNIAAFQQRRELQAKRDALSQILTATFPKVRAVLDAPLQMRREIEQLRAAAGRAGDDDLEALLSAAATAWPADRGPVEALSFEPGRLSLAANGWNDNQIQQLRSLLQSEGWQLEQGEGKLTLSRAKPAAGR